MCAHALHCAASRAAFRQSRRMQPGSLRDCSTMRGRPGRRQALTGWPSSRNFRGVVSTGVNALLLSLPQQSTAVVYI